MGGSWGPLAEFLVVELSALFQACKGGRGVTSACESRKGSQCPPLGAQDGCSTMPAPGAPIGAAFLPGNIHRERSSYCGPTLLLMCLPIMVTCLSGRPKLLHNIPLIVIADLFRLFPYLTLGLSLGSELWVWASAPNPHLHWQEEYLRLGSQCGDVNLLCRLFLTVCCFLLLGLEALPLSGWISPLVRSLPKVQNISSFMVLSQQKRSHSNYFFLFPSWLCGSFLSFWKFHVFCQCSVCVLYESFLTCGCISIVFSMFLWKEVNSASYSSAILISSQVLLTFFSPLHSLSHCLNENLFGCSLFHLKKGIGLIWQTRLAPSWSFLMLLSLSWLQLLIFCFDICFYFYYFSNI